MSSDPNPLSNIVTVTAHAGAVILTQTGEASVNIVPRLSQALPVNSPEGAASIVGYFGNGPLTMSSVPGILSITPGVDWSNL